MSTIAHFILLIMAQWHASISNKTGTKVHIYFETQKEK